MKGRGYFIVGLENSKNSFNVGATLRAAGIFGAASVFIQGKRYSKAGTDTMKAYKHMPLMQVDNILSVIPYDCVPVAVELIEGATPLPSYIHPPRAFYIFGPEDSHISKRTLSACRDTIYIPCHPDSSTRGCLNLAACVNVVLYDRTSKRYQVGN